MCGHDYPLPEAGQVMFDTDERRLDGRCPIWLGKPTSDRSGFCSALGEFPIMTSSSNDL